MARTLTDLRKGATQR